MAVRKKKKKAVESAPVEEESEAGESDGDVEVAEVVSKKKVRKKKVKKKGKKLKIDPSAKRGSAASILKVTQAAFGSELIKTLNYKKSNRIEGWSWGIPSVNLICTQQIDVGIPRGRIIEVFGPFSSGKTTVVLHAIADCQKKGGVVAFCDNEHALDPRYARALGVDLDKLLFSQPDCGEEHFDLMRALVAQKVDMIVTDSVAAMYPRAMMAATSEKSEMGARARLMSQELGKIHGPADENGTSLIFINQIRNRLNVMFGSPETTTAGEALKFYSTIRLRISQSTTAENSIAGAGNLMSGGEKIKKGGTMTISCIKNKVAPPFYSTRVPIYYGRGIDGVVDLFKIAKRVGILKKSSKGWRLDGSREFYKDMNILAPKVMSALEKIDLTSDMELDEEAKDDDE